MKVQRIMVGENDFNYILLDDEHRPVDNVTKYMKYLYNIGKAQETRHTYCTGLKFFYEYLRETGTNEQDISIYLISNYINWLHYGGSDITGPPVRSEQTVNLYLTIAMGYLKNLYVIGFLEKDKTAEAFEEVSGRFKPYKDFLYHVTKNKTFSRNNLKLKVAKNETPPLKPDQINLIMKNITNLRDEFLIRLLLNTGLRIGEALGLRHEDIVQTQDVFKIRIQDRGNNINGVFAKSGYHEVFLTRELIDLYDDYCFYTECELDCSSDYVFIKIHGPNAGAPMEKPDVYSLFGRLKTKTGINLFPHLLRRTYGTEAYLASRDIEYVRETMGHKNIQTTISSYVFPSDEEKLSEWKRVQKKMKEESDHEI